MNLWYQNAAFTNYATKEKRHPNSILPKKEQIRISKLFSMIWQASSNQRKALRAKTCFSFFHSHWQPDISSSTSETRSHTAPSPESRAVLVSRAVTLVNFVKPWLRSHQCGFLRSVLSCPQRWKATSRPALTSFLPWERAVSWPSEGQACLMGMEGNKAVVFWGVETHQNWDQLGWWLAFRMGAVVLASHFLLFVSQGCYLVFLPK